jgi:hypothetical protein
MTALTLNYRWLDVALLSRLDDWVLEVVETTVAVIQAVELCWCQAVDVDHSVAVTLEAVPRVRHINSLVKQPVMLGDNDVAITDTMCARHGCLLG